MITYASPLFVEVWLIYDAAKWGTLLETVVSTNDIMTFFRYIGESYMWTILYELVKQTARINEILYEQKWYDSSARFGKYTMMWIQSTNEPFRLTAFNMFYVNMKHFQDVCSKCFL